MPIPDPNTLIAKHGTIITHDGKEHYVRVTRHDDIGIWCMSGAQEKRFAYGEIRAVRGF